MLRSRLPAPAIGAFYAFRATQHAAFTLPIHVLFFQARGLSLAEVGLVEAVYTVVVLVSETPTGYVGDRIGRRNSLLVGTVLSAVGIAGFVLAHTLAAFVAVVALRGVAATFRSGTQEAWLYDRLAGGDDAERYSHVSGRARAVGLATMAGASLAGAALYAVDHLLPWLVEGVAVLAGAGVLLTLPAAEGGGEMADGPDDENENPKARIEDGDAPAGDETSPPDPDEAPDASDDEEPPGPLEALRVARDTLWRRSIGPAVLAAAVLAGVLNTMQFYVQPVAVATPWLSPATLGPLYAGFTLLSAVASDRAGWVGDRLGPRGWLLLGPPVLAALLLAVAAVPALALGAFLLARVVGPVTRPVVGQYINDRTDGGSRATVLSAASTVRSLFVAPLNVVGGALTGVLALTTALGVLGAVLLVGVALSLALWQTDAVRAGTTA